MEDPDLVQALTDAGVEYRADRPSATLRFLLAWGLPLALILLFWIYMLRGIASPSQSAMSFGRSRAKLVADKDVGVGFADVAGCDEAKEELQEIVEFLRYPKRFTDLGAKIPHGALLVGPPGTGKTLMARAAAGEAKVPFFALSGSDFVEMFVGVGAARVRDLFVQAKAHAPCIVFIDELDAIGKRRGIHIGQVNDEREQTLNQLLVELDGFEPNTGVILLSATNRPDVLDPALLRPGRFDRQIVIDSPDIVGREAILRVHARSVKISPDADLTEIARLTPGFSGADLANAINEAALLAARRNAASVTQTELVGAVERVIAGPERKSRRLDQDEKRRVAFHEAGHALVASYSKGADPVRKISIVPRGRAALGYTLQLPTGEHLLLTESELKDRIKALMGGRCAEELVFEVPSTGAENDLEHATTLARQIVCRFGMGTSAGLMHCAPDVDALPSALVTQRLQRDCSEETARQIDIEVMGLLGGAHDDAMRLLEEHRDQLDRVALALLERETLSEGDFQELLAEPATAQNS